MFELEKPYKAPSWANKLQAPSHGRVRLGQFPTAIHLWDLPRLPPGCEVFIKRDDLSGMQLSGNKVRKLEFLLAEAKATGCDSVITIGGMALVAASLVAPSGREPDQRRLGCSASWWWCT